MTAGRSRAAGTPPVDPSRKALLGKVHVARKAVAMAEDDYRHLLERITGRRSAGDCDGPQLEAVVAEFVRLGFKATRATAPIGRPADHAVARKARALWISLHQLGAIGDASEAGLEAFSRRQLGVDRLQWANQSEGFRLIEALKAIGDRHGWNQKVPARLDVTARVRLLKDRLVAAQLAKLAMADVVPPVAVPADRDDWTMVQLDRTIRQLAASIRRTPALVAID